VYELADSLVLVVLGLAIAIYLIAWRAQVAVARSWALRVLVAALAASLALDIASIRSLSEAVILVVGSVAGVSLVIAWFIYRVAQLARNGNDVSV
jgi:hypothetical protein